MKKINLTIAFVLAGMVAFAQVRETDLLNKAQETVREQIKQNLSLGLKTQEALNAYNMVVQSRYSYQEQVRVIAAMREAYQKGATAEAIASKVSEGLAKNVSADQMEKALNNVANRYAYAKQLAERVSKEDNVRAKIINNIAEAMAAGLQDRDIESLMTRERIRQDKELAVEVTEMVRDMVRARVNSQEAVRTMMTAVDKGYSAKEIAEIRNMFKNNVRTMNATYLAQNMKYGFQQGYRGAEMSGSMSSGSGKGGAGSGSGSSGSGGGGSGGGSGGTGGSGGGSGGGHGGGGRGR